MLGLSQTTGYAILALACIPDPGGRPVLVRDIAKCTGIARPYLSKIIHALGEAGLVETKRGHRGGVLLSRPAAAIPVLDVLEAIEGPGALSGCLLGRTDCSDERACPTHHFWKHMRGEVRANLARMTLAEVSRFERRHGVLSRCCEEPACGPGKARKP